METKAGRRTRVQSFKPSLLRVGESDIAQFLHPTWLARDNVPQLAEALHLVNDVLDRECPNVKLVLTGGGLLEFLLEDVNTSRYWRSEAALNRLVSQATDSLRPLLLALAGTRRDFLIGIDFVVRGEGVGQFAALCRPNSEPTLVWKSYPVASEENNLAGFGTPTGRRAPRVAVAGLGTTLVLVCHDAQAFNHRNIALVRAASAPTLRAHAIKEMVRQVESGRPAWAFNLVHCIGKTSSMATFHKSYKQIHQDFPWHPKAVGAFGYDLAVVNSLSSLAKEAQFPSGTCHCTLVLRG